MIAFYGLAAGFLNGKYRSATRLSAPREKVLARHTNPRGFGTLANLDTVAERHDTTPTQVALV